MNKQITQKRRALISGVAAVQRARSSNDPSVSLFGVKFNNIISRDRAEHRAPLSRLSLHFALACLYTLARPFRVTIVLSKFHKHTLPVDPSCAYSHSDGMDLVIVDEHLGKTACRFADGSNVENKDDLWRCMHEANCRINDDWLQMSVFRDPRPAVVSSYFHRQVQGSKHVGMLEDFIARELPILCQWLAIRYILFVGLIPTQSMSFWYNEAIADPLEWHYHWFSSIGLQLPPHFVLATANSAVADDLGFRHKDIDVHPGETPMTKPGIRRFEDEVSPAIVQVADAVLRVWLPPVLLERFGVAP